MSEELRCYTFTNFMLSSIQQGIQSGHAMVELFNKYHLDNGLQVQQDMLRDWAQNHKTLVCLNGGNADDVRDIKGFFDIGHQRGQNAYPYAAFFEDEASLDGALTSVAVILPARIFDAAAALRSKDPSINAAYDYILNVLRVTFYNRNGSARIEEFNQWESQLLDRLNKASLAR